VHKQTFYQRWFTMKEKIKSTLRKALIDLRDYFFTGLLVFIPIFLTLWLLYWAFDTIDNILNPWIEDIFGRSYPGIGVAATLFLILVCGVIGSRVFGRNIIRFMEYQLSKVPVVRELYNGIKQILESFSRKESSSFLEVVFIEFPRKGTFTPALVTSKATDESGKNVLNIYVPTAPNPTSGFLQILPEDQVIKTNMSVDDALKMVISVGKFSHEDVRHLYADDSK